MTSSLDLIRTTKTPMWVILNAVAAQGSETEEVAEAVAALNVEVCPVRLGRRVAFARALVSGLTAQEFQPAGKAAAEIGRLHELVSTSVADPKGGEHG